MSRNSLLETGAKSEVYVTATWTRTQNHLVHKLTLNHLAKLVAYKGSTGIGAAILFIALGLIKTFLTEQQRIYFW